MTIDAGAPGCAARAAPVAGSRTLDAVGATALDSRQQELRGRDARRLRTARTATYRTVVGGLRGRCLAARLGRLGGLVSDRDRHRDLGPESDGRLGLRHHELRLLGRDRSRGHAHLGRPLALSPEVAHVDQPLRRGDDDLRGDLRWTVSGDPHGAAVARLLGLPVSELPRARCGSIGVRLCSGTCSRSARTSRFRSFSGTSD